MAGAQLYKPLRLGVSTSSFLHMMPREVVQVLIVTSQTGIPHYLNDEQNASMAEYTSDIMQAINSSGIESVECYHSTVWDGNALMEIMSEYSGIEFWSAHASYGSWVDPSSPNENIRLAAIQAYKESIDMAAKLGAGLIVAHPGAQVDYDVPRQDRIELSALSLTEVADYAAERRIQVAVEPLPKQEPGNSLDEVLEILEKIDRPNTGINFDVNHLFPASAVPGLIKRAGERIKSVHISDQDDSERHWLPFKGKLDWKEVLGALANAGYSGPLIYETHIKEASSCAEIADMVVENYSRLISLLQ